MRTILKIVLFPIKVVLAIIIFAALSAAQHPALCKVIMSDGSTGSGTLVYKGPKESLILTAAHVVGGNTRARCFLGGRNVPAHSPVTPRERFDAALLTVKTSDVANIPEMQIYQGRIQPGLEVWAEGFAGNYGFGRRRGQVKTVAPTFETTFLSHPGDSGGVIYTMVQGKPELVAVVSGSNWPGRSPDSTGYTVGPCSHQIIPWFKRTLRGRNHPSPYGQQQPGGT